MSPRCHPPKPPVIGSWRCHGAPPERRAVCGDHPRSIVDSSLGTRQPERHSEHLTCVTHNAWSLRCHDPSCSSSLPRSARVAARPRPRRALNCQRSTKPSPTCSPTGGTLHAAAGCRGPGRVWRDHLLTGRASEHRVRTVERRSPRRVARGWEGAVDSDPWRDERGRAHRGRR